MPFWRREPLHEQLAREGGLVERPPHDPSPRWGEVGIHGVHRQRVWDAVATVDAPELRGTEVVFVCLPDGSLLVEEGELGVEPLAEALEPSVSPPYRAEAVQRGEGLWAVAARRIRVVEVAEAVDGDNLTVTKRGTERTVEVDGSATFGSIPTLERLVGEDAALTAHRLDGALWEVDVTPF